MIKCDMTKGILELRNPFQVLGCLLHAFTSIGVGRDSDGKAACGFVLAICEIASQVEDNVNRGTHQIANDNLTA